MLFLNAKPWLIFSLMIGVPIIGTIIVVLMATAMGLPGLIPLGTVVLCLPLVIIYFGWLWNAGVHLIGNPQNRRLFKILSLSSLVCAFLIVPSLLVMEKANFTFLVEIIRLLNFAAFLYCIHLIRKGLHERTEEAGSPVRSTAVDFISIWILPIGIWFIQPRIQQALKPRPEGNVSAI